MKKLRLCLPAAMTVLASMFVLAPQQAFAAPVPAVVPASWYMDTISTTTHDNLGCRQADNVDANAGTQNLRLFLLYGAPVYADFGGGVWRYGATAYDGPTASVGQVITAMKAFANGYARCISDKASRVIVSMSVTNYAAAGGSSVGYGHGVAWADGVRQVRDHIYNNGYSSFLDADAGGDLELEYATPAATKGWVDGFNTSSNFQRMNAFGSSSGCPTSDGDYGDCVSGGYRWLQESVHYINYGAAAAHSFPQNYNTSGTTAKQRKGLRKRHGTYYSGVLTQQGACAQVGTCTTDNNTPSQGYTQLYDALNADPATAQGISWLSDIRWCFATRKSTGYCG